MEGINWTTLQEIPEVALFFRVGIILVLGYFLLFLVSLGLGRLLRSSSSPHATAILRKLLFYLGSVAILATIFIELGFDLTGVLATAGIATVAVGFAAQTSLSNIISGLFLIGEKPFQIGDLIRANDILGVVHSIDLLSIKLRTLDNLYIRIPNESMIKNPLTNVTHFPIRRMDIDIGVAYKEDAGRVMEILKELAKTNPYALDQPEPLILFNNFGESALEFRFGLWFEKSNYLALRNSILKEIKTRFDEEGIEIPFPHLTLYSGSATEAFPVEVRGERKAQS
jgi:small-conductance mechanosensitive channel